MVGLTLLASIEHHFEEAVQNDLLSLLPTTTSTIEDGQLLTSAGAAAVRRLLFWLVDGSRSTSTTAYYSLRSGPTFSPSRFAQWVILLQFLVKKKHPFSISFPAKFSLLSIVLLRYKKKVRKDHCELFVSNTRPRGVSYHICRYTPEVAFSFFSRPHGSDMYVVLHWTCQVPCLE